MNFENYEEDDFLMDESFLHWVNNPDSEDGKFWEAWLKDHPDKRFASNQAKKILMSVAFSDKSLSKPEIVDIWKKISVETGYKEKQVISRFIFPWKYVKIAAVILPFVVATVLFLFFREMPAKNQVTKELIEKHNPRGQKSTIFLSDGSKVILNAASSLNYLKPFDENQRIVNLEGEAFFEVIPDKHRPFIVRSGNIETKVVGTSFNVEAYPDEDNIKVAVKSGMVSVQNKKISSINNRNGAIMLSPMEMIIYSGETNNSSISKFNPVEVLGWSEGTLHFENASMQEFVKKLERWYGVDIIVDRKRPIAKGITGTYRNETLEEILMGHKDASEFEYTFLPNGKVLIK